MEIITPHNEKIILKDESAMHHTKFINVVMRLQELYSKYRILTEGINNKPISIKQNYECFGSIWCDDFDLEYIIPPYHGKGRYSIRIDRKKYSNCHEPINLKKELTFKISLSATKTAEQIAKDIIRRIVPNAIEYKKIMQEKLKEHNEYIEAKANIEERLTKIIPGLERPSYASKDSNVLNARYNNITIKVTLGSDTICLDLNWITPEQAETILKVLRGN